jgi:hypothetical protein
VDERVATTAGASQNLLDERALLAMPNTKLDELFRRSGAGSIPLGDCKGTVLVFTGSRLAPVAAAFCRAVVWQGKVFPPDGRQVVNRVSPFGICAVRAAVSLGRSWVDDGECVVIDYSRTSIVACWVRDEIRLVAPGLYLGVVWLRRRRVAGFALRVPAR